MVFTRLAAVKRKYILPTNANKQHKDNSNNDASISNIVSTKKPTCLTRIVPETQTQVVEATQGVNVPSSTIVASQDEVSSTSDKGFTATELRKLQVKELIPKKKGRMKHQILLLLRLQRKWM